VVLGDRPAELEAVLARRHAVRQDRFDEIWQGEYHVAPMAHPAHGYVASQLVIVLAPFAARAGLISTEGFNLGTEGDYRVPDGGYHRRLPTTLYVPTAAVVVEVVSPHDETWAKFDFYAAREVDEICIAEPEQTRLAWWVRRGARFEPSDLSVLLGVSAAELAGRIDWPTGPSQR
jgi:Uma2 family endonuclease